MVEVALWLLFCFPGIIYSLWRLTTRYDACPVCGGAGMIPADSPRGRQLVDIIPPPAPIAGPKIGDGLVRSVSRGWRLVRKRLHRPTIEELEKQVRVLKLPE